MAFSKLLGQDANSVAPKTARKHFDDAVQKIISDDGLDFSSAWNKAKGLHPECLDRAMCKDEPEIQSEIQEAIPLANALTGRTAPRAGKPLILPALGLPMDATDDEYDVAYTANKGQHHTRNSSNILMALIAHLMGKHALNIDAAKAMAEKRYPSLWAVAGDKPVQPRFSAPSKDRTKLGPFQS